MMFWTAKYELRPFLLPATRLSTYSPNFIVSIAYATPACEHAGLHGHARQPAPPTPPPCRPRSSCCGALRAPPAPGQPPRPFFARESHTRTVDVVVRARRAHRRGGPVQRRTLGHAQPHGLHAAGERPAARDCPPRRTVAVRMCVAWNASRVRPGSIHGITVLSAVAAIPSVDYGGKQLRWATKPVAV